MHLARGWTYTPDTRNNGADTAQAGSLLRNLLPNTPMAMRVAPETHGADPDYHSLKHPWGGCWGRRQ